MKNLILLLIIFISYQSFSNERTVNVDKSFVKWTGKEITTKIHYGKLNISSGSITVDDNGVSGEVNVNMESLVVEDLQGEWGKKLEGHLKSDDFFSVDKFKESSIKTISSSRKSDNSYEVQGVLTIKGISHPITFDLDINGDIINANLRFDRSLYDVRFRSGSFFENLGDKLIVDDIDLEVTLELN
tara:strand:- start:56 stop:613 length:558 start_codon:yes stop_codon:yes gene_type:complete